jgi:hypothetical protein
MSCDDCNKPSSGQQHDPSHKNDMTSTVRAASGRPPAATGSDPDKPSLDAAIGLNIKFARSRVDTCAVLMRNAEAAFIAKQEALAIDAVLDAEPLLYEAQHLLNAVTILRRIMREAGGAVA